VEAAYYLVHSMGATGNFEEQDRQAARNFGAAARGAGVRRIIYLGGLAEEGQHLSAHLRSRHEVGRTLRESGVLVIEFRASIIIGSGSLSFEMIRALVERLPVMVTPRWVQVTAQPIAIGDVLAYLRAALAVETGNRSLTIEIGGPECVSYGDLMREYARQRGLRRLMIPVPLLTPRLSSLWLGLVTPLYVCVGRKLVDSLRQVAWGVQLAFDKGSVDDQFGCGRSELLFTPSFHLQAHRLKAPLHAINPDRQAVLQGEMLRVFGEYRREISTEGKVFANEHSDANCAAKPERLVVAITQADGKAAPFKCSLQV